MCWVEKTKVGGEWWERVRGTGWNKQHEGRPQWVGDIWAKSRKRSGSKPPSYLRKEHPSSRGKGHEAGVWVSGTVGPEVREIETEQQGWGKTGARGRSYKGLQACEELWLSCWMSWGVTGRPGTESFTGLLWLVGGTKFRRMAKTQRGRSVRGLLLQPRVVAAEMSRLDSGYILKVEPRICWCVNCRAWHKRNQW